jgi:hypothetical protein
MSRFWSTISGGSTLIFLSQYLPMEIFEEFHKSGEHYLTDYFSVMQMFWVSNMVVTVT